VAGWEAEVSLTDALAALRAWLHDSRTPYTGDFRVVIEVPTIEDEARLRLALAMEFEHFAIGQLDLDKPLRIMGFDVEFKWPKG
jgi:hypothetical protein